MVLAHAGDNRGQVGDTPTPADYFHALPIITRCWFGATMVMTLSVNFGIVDGYHVAWIWERVSTKLELWRALTTFCYAGGFSLNTLILLYMQVQFSKKYEMGVPFNTGAGGGTADYAFCLILGMLGIMLTYPLCNGMGYMLRPLFCENLVYYVLYVWSKKNPTNQSNIWGFPIQGVYLPFAYLALTVLMGNPFEGMLQGMVIGHLYYFAADAAPIVYGKDFLQTPGFLIDYFGHNDYTPPPSNPYRSGGSGGFGSSNGGNSTGFGNSGAQQQAQPRSGGHNWGSGGNRLGTN